MRCDICGKIILGKAIRIDNETIVCEDCAEMLDGKEIIDEE